jgi:membrane protease YdiL (CAAX protease family)
MISIALPLLLFALGHAPYGTARHVIAALIAGSVLTFAYSRFKNLLANMIAHSLFDFLLFLFHP